MSYFIVEICTDNASFEDEGKANEISRILKKIAGKIGAGGGDGRCADINGNTVATYFFGPAPAPAPAPDAHLMADYDENNGDNAPLDYEPENGGGE